MSPGRIKRISLLLLALGFGSALAIYLTAEPVVRDPLFESQLGNKKYVHDLTVMGGKANVISAELIEWFDGLWHGPNLAGTVAVLTVLVTLAFRFVAARPELYGGPPGAPDPHRTD